MVTVVRGRKARLIGGAVGVVILAVAAALFAIVSGRIGSGPTESNPWVYLFPAAFGLFGLFTLGKALFQSDYRVILNRHRGRGRIRLGRPIRDDPEPLYDEDDV